MEPDYANAVCCRRTKPPKPMEGAHKPSSDGGGRGCFPCIGSMIMGSQSSRHPMNTPLRRALTNTQKHANHAQGVQYATNSFVCGRYGWQACGLKPATSAKSRKRGFQCTTSSASRLSTTLLRLS